MCIEINKNYKKALMRRAELLEKEQYIKEAIDDYKKI